MATTWPSRNSDFSELKLRFSIVYFCYRLPEAATQKQMQWVDIFQQPPFEEDAEQQILLDVLFAKDMSVYVSSICGQSYTYICIYVYIYIQHSHGKTPIYLGNPL